MNDRGGASPQAIANRRGQGLQVGQAVEVKHGALAGISGVLIGFSSDQNCLIELGIVAFGATGHANETISGMINSSAYFLSILVWLWYAWRKSQAREPLLSTALAVVPPPNSKAFPLDRQVQATRLGLCFCLECAFHLHQWKSLQEHMPSRPR